MARLLLDENLPRGLCQELGPHLCRTVVQERWSGVRNGALLRRAADAGFDVFVTMDRSIRYQQAVQHLPLAIIVLRAQDNTLETLSVLRQPLLDAIEGARPGSVVEVGR